MAKIITISVLIIAVAIAAVYYFYFFDRPTGLLDKIVEDDVLVIDQKGEPGESGAEQPAAVLTRQKHMAYVKENLDKLSPVKPILGGAWYPLRFWFASDDEFYVEYEDGHIMRRILVEAIGGEKILSSGEHRPFPYEYEVRAYFEPGESDWTLKTGQDTLFAKSLDLYEYNEASQKWEEGIGF